MCHGVPMPTHHILHIKCLVSCARHCKGVGQRMEAGMYAHLDGGASVSASFISLYMPTALFKYVCRDGKGGGACPNE